GRVTAVGNLKYDQEWTPMDPEERDGWVSLLDLEPDSPVWVAGSTHPGEEEILLDAFLRLMPDLPRLRLIIAPRRIERVDRVCMLARERGLDPALRSELGVAGGKGRPVVVVDTLGELGRLYGIATVAFVGGSLAPFGGHNLLEPAAFGCPVLFGPHTHNFVLMSELLLETGGGRRVRDGGDLYRAVMEILLDPEQARVMGEKARQFVENNRGALDRVLDRIGDCLESSSDRAPRGRRTSTPGPL
ncbi:MAG: hypothetical protein JW821_19450, partial [Deltaproteobacteria bacterium]|nr:hypothetical protein [Deltaproteobacteria bacterium]